MINTILFDLDGTLVDTAPDFVITVNELLAKYDKPPIDDNLIRNSVSDGASALITLAFNITEKCPDFSQKRQELLTLYRQHLGKHSVLFPGMDLLLTTLRKESMPWGIVTNKPEQFTTPLVEALLTAYPPDAVVCPDHVSASKPSPEGLLLACQQIGCIASETLYVGDHKRDIDSGIAAGMKTIAVNFGYIKPEDDTSHWQADHCIDHSDEIWPLVKHYRT